VIYLSVFGHTLAISMCFKYINIHIEALWLWELKHLNCSISHICDNNPEEMKKTKSGFVSKLKVYKW